MLPSLNDYDQQQVMKEIDYVTRYPSSTYSTKHSLNPFRRIYRTCYPFRSYHYLLEYKTNGAGQVVIDDIYFQTEHAAVNGMQNELNKAAWLMGMHAQAAYSADGITGYTLFHNPSDGWKLDLAECVFDKLSRTKSHNAQHLAAILSHAHKSGKAIKWEAPYQGAIIFNAALLHYRAAAYAVVLSFAFWCLAEAPSPASAHIRYRTWVLKPTKSSYGCLVTIKRQLRCNVISTNILATADATTQKLVAGLCRRPGF